MAKRTVLTRENAEALAQRDGGYFCHYCGAPVAFHSDIPEIKVTVQLRNGRTIKDTRKDPSVKSLQIDHKTAKAKGGSDDLDNLLLACTKCNQRKGKKDYSDFLKWLKG